MLIYSGNGAFQYPYPARDLSESEVNEFGKEVLLATGLYQEPPIEKAEKKFSPARSTKES